MHTHIVIGARGRGVLVLGSRRETLAPMDVACIGPLEAHQLRNESSEPFGFFCIVDHDRDRAHGSVSTPPAASPVVDAP